MKKNLNTNYILGSEIQSPRKMGYSLKRTNMILRPNIKKKDSIIELDNSNILIRNVKLDKRIHCLGKIWNKIKKKLVLMLTILFMLYVYYIYVLVNIKYNNLITFSSYFILFHLVFYSSYAILIETWTRHYRF